MTYFLDTNICICFMKGFYPQLLDKMLSKKPHEIKIPAIVKAELLYGAEKSAKPHENLAKFAAFFLPYVITPFGDAAATLYGKVRAELVKAATPIGPNDLFIAATVLAENATLVTNNTKEFSRIPSLRIENWLE